MRSMRMASIMKLGDKFWVSLYAPSTADWQAGGVKITTETDFPEGETATISIAAAAPKILSCGPPAILGGDQLLRCY